MSAVPPFPDEALRDVIDALPAEEEWPAYWVETPHGRTLHLCWPCCEALLRQLRRLLTRKRVARVWNHGEEWDSVTSAYDCECCGCRLDHRLNKLGINEELCHFESLTDLELAGSDINEIQRLAGSWHEHCSADLHDRTRETLLRFLRCRATPFDPTKHL